MRLRICLMLTMILAISAAHCVGHAATASDPQRQEALALEQQGKNVEAETAWRAFLKVHPSNAEAYAHLGVIEARQEHYKDAVPLYRKALALGPQLPGVRLNLGLALFKASEPKESLRILKPLLKNEPASSPMARQLVILIGMAHYGLREYAEAAPYLKEAAASDPQNLGNIESGVLQGLP